MGLREPRLQAAVCAVSLLVGAALVLSAAPAADPVPAAPPAPRGGRLVIGVRGDVTSFNLYTATNAFTQEITDLLFPRLADEQDDFRDGPPSFKPSLASSWALSSDRRTLTLRLDPHARWSDGRQITSADVLFSERAASSAEVSWVGGDVKELIADVAAPDPLTVVVHLKQDY